MTIIEIVWTALALVGFYFASLNAREALEDYQALGGRQNGRRTIALNTIRREAVRMLIALDFLAIGVMALFDVTPREVIALGLLLASAGHTVNSYLDRRERLYLLEFGLTPRDSKGRFTSG